VFAATIDFRTNKERTSNEMYGAARKYRARAVKSWDDGQFKVTARRQDSCKSVGEKAAIFKAGRAAGHWISEYQ
jgi:hypothetical protein